MEADKAAVELKVIRELMERPVRYSTMSGLSGILAGGAALLGVGLDIYLRGLLAVEDVLAASMCVWMGVLVAAFLSATILTRLRERKQDMPFWSSVKKRILLTILPPFVAAVVLTLAIVWRHQGGLDECEWGLIPAIWMLFYGVALWQVGESSVIDVRILGAAFMLSGAAAGFVVGQPHWTLGITFGGYHIVYGIFVWVRHGG